MEAFGKKHGRAWIFLTILVCAGCQTTAPIKEEFVQAPVHQIHSTWSNKVAVTTDYGANMGAELPGLVGRLYLMGPDLGHTVKSNGRVAVDLYDAAQAGPPKFLGRWQIAKENLERLGQKDIIGLGYTLFLPWPDYNPKFTKLQLQVSYFPDEGPVMIAPRYALSLTQDEFKSMATVVRPQPPANHETPRMTDQPEPAGSVLVTTQEAH